MILRFPLADTELLITYVIDYPKSVTYISTKQIIQLGLNEDSLRELAMANIEKTFPTQVVKDVLEKQTLSVVK